MSINEQLLAALSLYGIPVLFGAMVINSIGIPIPGPVVLIAAGSFVHLGDLNLGGVLVLGSLGAIIGDQIGYGIGRWGGRRLVQRTIHWLGGENRLQTMEALTAKWGGPGIFLSRWLITGLGSWINLLSGIARYPYTRFLLWDISGEILWVVLFVFLGEVLSDRVQAMFVLMGNLFWVEVGLAAAILFGWILFRNYRKTHKKDE